jgi:antitoxin CptB
MDARKKRLAFRARHMGTAENDSLIGSFSEHHLANFSNDQLDKFENLLQVSDSDLFRWATGQGTVPPEHDHDVLRLLQAFSAARKTSEQAR